MANERMRRRGTAASRGQRDLDATLEALLGLGGQMRPRRLGCGRGDWHRFVFWPKNVICHRGQISE